MTTKDPCCGACTCAHTTATEVLKGEHRVIERVLDAIEGALALPHVDRAFFAQAIDFLRNFADGCHHAKEENALFPALAALGVPNDGGPIGCMLDDHAPGRALIRIMSDELAAAAAGDAAATLALRSAALRYVELLRRHIWKEDNVVFTLADRVLGGGYQASLREAFERTEQSAANAGQHERYLKIADQLQHWARGTAAPAAAGSSR